MLERELKKGPKSILLEILMKPKLWGDLKRFTHWMTLGKMRKILNDTKNLWNLLLTSMIFSIADDEKMAHMTII